MNQKTITISDIARLAGVSKTTVSRVLNNSERVKPQTRQLIKDVMAENNYKPNIIAQSLRSGFSKTIGVIIPDYTNVFYSYVFKELEIALNSIGYMAIICPVTGNEDREREYCQKLLSRNIDGIIYFDYHTNENNKSFLIELSKKIPLVLMDEPEVSLNISQVSTDGFDALYRSTTFFIKNGHKNIACLASHLPVTSNQLKGYLAAMKDNGLDVAKENIILLDEFSFTAGTLAAKSFLQIKERPTALVSVGDYPAIGMINTLMAEGVRIPEDVEIIAFDNIELSYSMKPKLSTVAQPVELLASKAVEILVNQIEDAEGQNKNIKLQYKGELILRDTTVIKNNNFKKTLA